MTIEERVNAIEERVDAVEERIELSLTRLAMLLDALENDYTSALQRIDGELYDLRCSIR